MGLEAALIGLGSTLGAGICMGIGAMGPGIGEGNALAKALEAIAQQPDESRTITRTLFVGMAMVESTGIYSFVVAMILLFANPIWEAVKATVGSWQTLREVLSRWKASRGCQPHTR